jgi:glycosyltransferase involved in cell wall biosynthesis
MSLPLISCIVPVFNGERYIREALESILAQAYRPLEIIVADDGSTDRTAEIVSTFGDQVRYLKQNNAGPAAARNLGIGAAFGEFIAFLDADDLWHPEKLLRQTARFAARPELSCCVTHVQNFWIPELRAEAEQFREHRISKPLPGYVTSTLLVRREFFDAVGPFNAGMHHADDTEWFLRAEERGGVMELLPDVLLYRRLHVSNLSRVRAPQSREQYLEVVKAALDRRRENKPPVPR